jgi:hypothetical protein
MPRKRKKIKKVPQQHMKKGCRWKVEYKDEVIGRSQKTYYDEDEALQEAQNFISDNTGQHAGFLSPNQAKQCSISIYPYDKNDIRSTEGELVADESPMH